MNIQEINGGDFSHKKILVRADFNVAIVNGKVQERFKLEACKETIEYLCGQAGAKIALASHLGRPEGKMDPQFSLVQLKGEIEQILDKKIVFVSDCVGGDVGRALAELHEGEVLLLENVRFYEGEEKNDPEFSQQLAANFDAFVNDAFSVCHRDQASITGVTRFLPSYAGFWLMKEIENLDRVLQTSENPATAIIGGAKIETKLPLIEVFEKKYSHILVGGKIANEAVDQELSFSGAVLLPVDFVGDRMDIGEKTIEKYCEIIRSSKVVVWNGPMGKFEEKPYDRGTRAILAAVVESQAFTLVGGGESVQVLEEEGLLHQVSFVSTGGGAMLEYLSGNAMPGIESLKK